MGYRDASIRCVLCGAETTEPQNYAGVVLCSPCHDGRNARARTARGIHVQTVEEQAITNEGRHRRDLRYAFGASDRALPLQARFGREGFFGRRFKSDLQTGDTIFDDAIAISGKGVELERLLSHEPVRLAIMDLVAGGEVAINDGEVQARGHELGEGELYRAVATIVWGLATLSEAAAYPKAPSRLLPWREGLSVHTTTGLAIRGDRFDLRQLAGLEQLGFLSLAQLELLGPDGGGADLAPLVWLPRLESLRLIRIAEVRDLAPLASASSLHALVLRGCPVEDLAPLAHLSGLRGLNVSDTRVRDLSPVLTLPLEELIVGSQPIPHAQLEELRARRPDIRIS
jgi:hypothetical protein